MAFEKSCNFFTPIILPPVLLIDRQRSKHAIQPMRRPK